MTTDMTSFPEGGLAVVIGASGGIGGALAAGLVASGRFARVAGLSRSADGLDLTDPSSIARAAEAIAATALPLRLVIVATGLLHDGAMQPEKSLRQLDAETLARSFAVNASGPMLVAQRLLPVFPREGKAVFAAISAKVGSIGDNALGGWYGYRAAKAALNQLVHTAAIELQRTRPQAICVTLHPGTVDTPLSAPFGSAAHPPVTPELAARRLLSVIEGLTPARTGLFLDHSGEALPW